MSNAPALRPATMADVIRAHKIARSVHDDRQMAFIEDTLTGINYTHISNMLRDGEYTKAAELRRSPAAKD